MMNRGHKVIDISAIIAYIIVIIISIKLKAKISWDGNGPLLLILKFIFKTK